jgi:phosphoribosylanthranilate isomerase
VDRVRSAHETRTVKELGAGLVGVHLATDPRFADDRAVTVLEAAGIGRSLRRAGLVLVMELRDAERVREVVAETGATLVQPIIGTVPPEEVRAALRATVLTIAEQARRGDARCHPYAAVLGVLRAIS